MTPNQIKRRDELAQEFDKASWYGRRSLDYFEAGYEAGYEDSEVNKAACCMEMEQQNKELTRKLEVAKEALKSAVKNQYGLQGYLEEQDYEGAYSYMADLMCAYQDAARAALKELE